MSLFKARDWWRTTCGHSEEFDSGCLCIANIDNDQSGRAKVVTGSLQGLLRIYQAPTKEFKLEDLLLEHDVGGAILQLEAGRFSASGGLQLAVLHPRKLAVYAVLANPSGLQLAKQYEHYLEHTAANMAFGSFGGVKGADYICVQSYDGQLSFFEQESFAFSRFLPNFLVPGPLCYCEATDSIVTCNAGFELECYKFKVLASAGSEKTVASQSGTGQSKKLQAEWMLVLGEAAISISTGSLTAAVPGGTSSGSDIIVVGEHTMFCVSPHGAIANQKRLEYHPACCITYPAQGSKLPGGSENLLVATYTKALLVYRGSTLCWAAKCDNQPVAVRVASFGGVDGMLVTLSDSGQLAIQYLGTDPPLNPVGHVEQGKELDYEEMDQEHRRLLAIIRDAASTSRQEPPERLVLRTQTPATFDRRHEDQEMEESLAGGSRISKRVTVKLHITFNGPGQAQDVHVSIRPPPPIQVAQDIYYLDSVREGDCNTETLQLVFFAGDDTSIPSCATAHIFASFATGSGEPRNASIQLRLPMCLFCKLVPPVKSAAFKITVDTNRQPPQLIRIFSDMLAVLPPSQAELLERGTGANVLSFQYPNGSDATILVSKNASRYRLQSDTFEAMGLVVVELCKRLEAYYKEAEAQGGSREAPFQVEFKESLPVQDFFELVDKHFEARQAVQKLTEELANRAQQFRSVQKRLLVRFKDRNPAALDHLGVLLEDTYSSLQDQGTNMEKAKNKQLAAAKALSAGVSLLQQLIICRFNLTATEQEVLCSHLSAEVLDNAEAGWEECTEASMTYLLKTALAKNSKEAAAALPQLTAAKDTARLKKHMALVLERLDRGMRLVKPEREKAAKPQKQDQQR